MRQLLIHQHRHRHADRVIVAGDLLGLELIAVLIEQDIGAVGRCDGLIQIRARDIHTDAVDLIELLLRAVERNGRRLHLDGLSCVTLLDAAGKDTLDLQRLVGLLHDGKTDGLWRLAQNRDAALVDIGRILQRIAHLHLARLRNAGHVNDRRQIRRAEISEHTPRALETHGHAVGIGIRHDQAARGAQIVRALIHDLDIGKRLFDRRLLRGHDVHPQQERAQQRNDDPKRLTADDFVDCRLFCHSGSPGEAD